MGKMNILPIVQIWHFLKEFNPKKKVLVTIIAFPPIILKPEILKINWWLNLTCKCHLKCT